MKTIWKYQVDPAPDAQIVKMPKGARMLTAREQGDQVCIWAEVDDTAPAENRRFEVVGTGWELASRPRSYIGTAHLSGGALVFHVFEVPA